MAEADALFLTDAEMVELTGYKQTAAQQKWLRRNGIPFTRQRVTGALRVVRATLAAGKRAGGEEEGPRLDWMKNRSQKRDRKAA
ncbi:MAG: DUF4224 domain-containing protein [Bradyrhizobium sp.]